MLTSHFLSVRKPIVGNISLHRKASGNYYHKRISMWNPHSSVWGQAQNSKLQGHLKIQLKNRMGTMSSLLQYFGSLWTCVSKNPWYSCSKNSDIYFPKVFSEWSGNLKAFLAQENSMKHLHLFLCCNWEGYLFSSAETRECVHRNDGRNIHFLTSPALLTGQGWIPLKWQWSV